MRHIASLLLLLGTASLASAYDALYVRAGDGGMVVIPQEYVTTYATQGEAFTSTLRDGTEFSLSQVAEVSEEEPEDMPRFLTYKFNNKYNSQLFTDAECTDTEGEDLRLSVGCIGKWLTASFTLNGEGTEAYVDTLRQRSKKTRQSFAQPVTYRLVNTSWKTLQPSQGGDASSAWELVDYCREVTVSVDFLADHPTGEYGVPRIDITLADASPWSETNWIGKNGKTYYEAATIEIDGAGVYPDMEETPIEIKGRGNTSWTSSWESKNPYHVKFPSKHKPLGMTSGKHWVLIANKQVGSMTTNAIGHKIGNLLATAGTNHIVPVELYINGSYRGAYDLTESVGIRNNSVVVNDETKAAMIEIDLVQDETVYYSNVYGLPSKIHSPNVGEEGVTLTAEDIIGDFDAMMAAAYGGTDAYLARVDPDYLSRYLLASEYVYNAELSHPKSFFLYSEDVTDGLNAEGVDETPWVFGPMWDFDWAFGYVSNRVYFVDAVDNDLYQFILRVGTSKGVAGQFVNALRYNSVEVDSLTYRLAYKFVNEGGLDELLDYCDDYYAFASSAFEHNKANETVNRDSTDYALTTANAKTWLDARMRYILSTLTPYEVVEDEEEDVADGIGARPASLNGTPPRGAAGVYDLSGRRVGEPKLKGVYIVDGRKVVVR